MYCESFFFFATYLIDSHCICLYYVLLYDSHYSVFITS